MEKNLCTGAILWQISEYQNIFYILNFCQDMVCVNKNNKYTEMNSSLATGKNLQICQKIVFHIIEV